MTDAPTTSPVIDQQLRHRSIRAFTDETIPQETLEAILRAGQSAASSSFIQAYSVIRVTQPDLRSAIAQAAGGQAWIEQAPEFLVFCADLRRIDAACRRGGAGEVEGYAEHGVAALVDTALMAQNVLLAAESLGLGGVFIGGIRNDLERVSELLAVPRLVVPVFGMCLGRPAADPDVKPRMPLSLVLHQDAYADPPEEAVAGYDALMQAYFGARAGGTRAGDWTSTTAKAVQGKKRTYLLGFLQRQGFFLR
jgi:nitroreductase